MWNLLSVLLAVGLLTLLIAWGKVQPLLNFVRTELYLACNRQLPDALIAELARHVSALQREGVAAAIDARYERWPQPAR